MSRPIYEAVVPWWETVARGEVPDDVEGVTEVDREFARLLAGMTKVVISRTIDPAPGREVIDGDIAAHLEKLKAGGGRDVILSCGPATLAPLTATPGLIDEYLVVVHPAVLGSGPRLFGGNTTDLGLRLAESKVFDGGCVVLRYETSGGPDVVKALLTSAGLSNDSIRGACAELLGKPIEEASAVQIVTAMYAMDEGVAGAWAMAEYFAGLGWRELGLLELTALPSIDEAHWWPALESADILLVGGGSRCTWPTGSSARAWPPGSRSCWRTPSTWA